MTAANAASTRNAERMVKGYASGSNDRRGTLFGEIAILKESAGSDELGGETWKFLVAWRF